MLTTMLGIRDGRRRPRGSAWRQEPAGGAMAPVPGVRCSARRRGGPDEPWTVGRGDRRLGDDAGGLRDRRPVGPRVPAGPHRPRRPVHEAAGFDRVLIGYYSNGADGFLTSALVVARDRAARAAAGPPPRASWPRRWRPASWPRSTCSAKGAPRCTSSAAVATPIRRAMVTSRSRRALSALGGVRGLLRRTWAATEPFDHEASTTGRPGTLSAVRPATGLPCRLRRRGFGCCGRAAGAAARRVHGLGRAVG